MKNLSLFAVVLIAAFVFSSCQNTATNTAANNGAAANTNTNTNMTAANNSAPAAASPTVKAELPPSNLKPEDINLDKPIPAQELRNAVFANEAAWKGKEVAVTGEYNGHSTSKLQSGDKHSINVQDDKREVVIKCDGRTEPPADVKDKRKDRVFKGTVSSVYKPYNQVNLEPCEIIK